MVIVTGRRLPLVWTLAATRSIATLVAYVKQCQNGLLENSSAAKLASRPYLKCVKIEVLSGKNSLDIPDSFFIFTLGFEFSDSPKMEV